MPPFSNLKFKKIKYKYKNKNKNLPRSVTKLSFFKAFIFFIYYMFDYLLGNIFIFFKNFSKDNHLIIYDRYIYEFFYQQIYYSLPDKLLLFFKIYELSWNQILFPLWKFKRNISEKKELPTKYIEDQINNFIKKNKKFKLNVSLLNTTEMRKMRSFNV